MNTFAKCPNKRHYTKEFYYKFSWNVFKSSTLEKRFLYFLSALFFPPTISSEGPSRWSEMAILQGFKAQYIWRLYLVH